MKTSSTIALVDDDMNIVKSLRIALEAEGFKVMTYSDGVSALEGLTRSCVARDALRDFRSRNRASNAISEISS